MSNRVYTCQICQKIFNVIINQNGLILPLLHSSILDHTKSDFTVTQNTDSTIRIFSLDSIQERKILCTRYSMPRPKRWSVKAEWRENRQRGGWWLWSYNAKRTKHYQSHNTKRTTQNQSQNAKLTALDHEAMPGNEAANEQFFFFFSAIQRRNL